MVRKFFVGAGVAMLAAAISVTTASAVYNTNATSVISNVVNDASATTVTNAIVGGFSGGSTGGAPGLFGAPQLSDSKSTKSRFRSKQTGLNAGGKESRLAVWVNGAYSYFDEDQSAIDSDGDVLAIATGADWRFSERLIAGLSVGYEKSDVTTTFNLGTLDTDGYFIAPYFAFEVTDNIFLDATAGYAWLESDASRSSTGTTITGSYDSDRTFGAVNLTGKIVRDELTIMPGVGVLYTRQESDAYTESDGSPIPSNVSRLGRLRGGARVQYQVTPKIAPYVRGDLEYDFKSDEIVVGAGQTQPTNDDTGAVLGAGMVFNLTDRIRGSVDGSTVLGRSDFEQYNLVGNLRFRF